MAMYNVKTLLSDYFRHHYVLLSMNKV